MSAYTEEDVRRYADPLSHGCAACTADERTVVRAVLDALQADGRLLPAPSRYEEFVRTLRAARIARDVRQGELARQLYVSLATMCRWETCSTRPTVRQLAGWAAAVGVAVPDGLDGEVHGG